MVNTAKAETAQAEKLLKEANGKIDVLQAEVKALKELVLTSTPSTPNKHLHPQLSQKSSHSRQSSLNQQTLNTIVINANANGTSNTNLSTQLSNGVNSTFIIAPTSTSTPGSSSSNQAHQSSLTNSNSFSKISEKSNSLQPFSGFSSKDKSSFFNKSHKRVPSHNDIQSQSKSIIDKLFSNKDKEKKDYLKLDSKNAHSNNDDENNEEYAVELAEVRANKI